MVFVQKAINEKFNSAAALNFARKNSWGQSYQMLMNTITDFEAVEVKNETSFFKDKRILVTGACGTEVQKSSDIF
ncbi:MAG: hypothetical protein R2874_12265 [Desulfobacterales bacterium]